MAACVRAAGAAVLAEPPDVLGAPAVLAGAALATLALSSSATVSPDFRPVVTSAKK